MKFNYHSIVLILALLMLVPVCFSSTGETGALRYETPGVLNIDRLLDPEFQQGKHYRVEPRVENDGLFNHYTIYSEFGDFKVVSNTSLKLRLLEIEAIAAMRQLDTGGSALQGLKQSAKKTVTGARNLITHPIDTIEGATQGAGELVDRTANTVRRTPGSTEDSKLAQIIGLSKAKGKIASRYGVNVYSRNPVLQQELSRLANASYLGGLSVGVAASFIPGASGLMLSTSSAARVLNESINDTPASEIWLQNKNKLLDMRLEISIDQLELFLNNAAFSPALQTVMVVSLESLAGVENRGLLMQLALEAKDVHRARLMTEIAVMAARYHKNIAPIQKFTPMARLVSAVTQQGVVLVLLPTDYIIWTEKIASVFMLMTTRANQFKNGAPELWTSGRISDRTRSELHAKAWKVRVDAGPLLRIKKQ